MNAVCDRIEQARREAAENPTDSESANKKLRAVAKAKRQITRLLTPDEVQAVETCAAWQNGWLMVAGRQVVVGLRPDGRSAAWRL